MFIARVETQSPQLRRSGMLSLEEEHAAPPGPQGHTSWHPTLTASAVFGYSPEKPLRGLNCGGLLMRACQDALTVR
jgi:hypothetical protein